jgi:hypothetical protein
MSDCSATRAARFADRTDAKVAIASTSVPPAVASEETVAQSVATASSFRDRGPARRRPDTRGQDPPPTLPEAAVAQLATGEVAAAVR